MSIQTETKLKNLLISWPMHTAIPVAWLKEKKYSASLLQRYVSSHWMTYVGRGIVARPHDHIKWSGLLWGLQKLYNFHVGGKTALELNGKAHFIKFHENDIFIFSNRGFKFPSGLKKNKQNINFINSPTNLFPQSIGLMEHDFGEYQLTISNPARAFCEYLHVIEKYHSYNEAYYLMENLHFVPHHQIQEALENCTSIKVKRLTLCLAKAVNVSWFNKLNLEHIDLGKGIRQGVKNGLYDDEFKITYPKSWKKDDDKIQF